jgi:hypothetical protein
MYKKGVSAIEAVTIGRYVVDVAHLSLLLPLFSPMWRNSSGFHVPGKSQYDHVMRV